MTVPGSLTPSHSLAALPGAPVAQAKPTLKAPTYQDTLASLWMRFGAEPVQLIRTREGRDLSRQRYRTSEEFFPSLDPDKPVRRNFLYFSGVTAQLAIASHLLDVGFPDQWCARHVGLYVDRSLAYANATGFGLRCEQTQRLVTILSPYWKWNHRSLLDNPGPDDGGFTHETVTPLLQALLAHVRHVTGHRRHSAY